MKTQFWGVAVGIAAIFTGSASAQGHDSPPEGDSSLACVERLQVPTYPVIARAARIEGSVTASVFLSSEASVQRIQSRIVSTLDKAKSLLAEPVENAIRAASFRPDCRNKTLTIIFNFSIVGQASDYPKQSVSFGYPNKFWITTEPHTPQP